MELGLILRFCPKHRNHKAKLEGIIEINGVIVFYNYHCIEKNRNRYLLLKG